MNRLFIIVSLFAISVIANAQDIYLCKDGDYTVKSISQGMDIDLAANYDSITFSTPQMTPVVTITYSETAANVKMPSFLTGVTASVNGADVVINSTNTTEEVAYIASGASANGSLTINGSYKLTLTLNGLNLTSQKGAPIDIQCGKRTELILTEGTTSTLVDATSGAQKACLYCRGHLEISGGGVLNVTGNKSHAISTKEYCQLKRTTGTINIVKSANDGIHAGQYFQMNGGTVNITETTAGDGIQAEITSDPTDENNGEVIIKGGTLNITTAGMDMKSLKADRNITISGGTFTLNANGNGSRGIQTDYNMVIGEEDNTTSILINATGDRCTNPDDADDPHNCMGMKIDGDLTINAGSVTVYNTGKKSKGIKVAGTYTNNGGTVNATITK